MTAAGTLSVVLLTIAALLAGYLVLALVFPERF